MQVKYFTRVLFSFVRQKYNFLLWNKDINYMYLQTKVQDVAICNEIRFK
jgi:hypothetical protein